MRRIANSKRKCIRRKNNISSVILISSVVFVTYLSQINTNAFAIPSTAAATAMQKIRQAMVLSNEGQTTSNISAAYTASSLWKDILDVKKKKGGIDLKSDTNSGTDNDTNSSTDEYIMPDEVRRICNALYAATLVRIGRDDDALVVYDETLDSLSSDKDSDSDSDNDMNIDIIDWSLWIDIKISKGEALQRLIRYEEARDEFTQVWTLLGAGSVSSSSDSNKSTASAQYLTNSNDVVEYEKYQQRFSQCAYKAALCSLRLDDIQSAEEILNIQYQYEHQSTTTQSISNSDSNIAGMLGIIQIEQSLNKSSLGMGTGMDKKNMDIEESSIELLKKAALSEDASPIYRWFYALVMTNRNIDDNNKDTDTDMDKNKNKDSDNDGGGRRNEVPFLFDESYDDNNTNNSGNSDTNKLNQFLKIASINQSPYDDPSLIHLDDKVLLHKLLSKGSEGDNINISSDNNNKQKGIHNHNTASFWPIGFILPNDEQNFKKYCNCEIEEENMETKKWIIKKRAGYGSHGNKIVSTREAMELSSKLSSTVSSTSNQEVLCQSIIEPTLCYERRRFSLRVYVIYFPSSYYNNNSQGDSSDLISSVYLSTIGLMKLALVEGNSIEDEDNINDIYMTNSGRVDGEMETQYDFEFLKDFIDKLDDSPEYHSPGMGRFEELWGSIRESVSHVMIDLFEKTSSSSRNKQQSMIGCVPKIMGFDYIVDASLKPWLMEVNRFPGLEARGGNDRHVKSRLIEEVWKLAEDDYRTKCGLTGRGCKTEHIQSLKSYSRRTYNK